MRGSLVTLDRTIIYPFSGQLKRIVESSTLIRSCLENEEEEVRFREVSGFGKVKCDAFRRGALVEITHESACGHHGHGSGCGH